MRFLPWSKSKYDADATARLIAALSETQAQDADTAAKVKQALDEHADPNAKGSFTEKHQKDKTYHLTALQNACLFKKMETARVLLNAGADVNLSATRKSSPLLDATFVARPLYYPLIKLLVDHGADVMKTDASGETALYRAMRNPSLADHGVNVVEVLLSSPTLKDKKAYVNRGSNTYTPLHQLMMNFNPSFGVEHLEPLLKAGADLNAVIGTDRVNVSDLGAKPLYKLSPTWRWSDHASARKFLELIKQYGGDLENTHTRPTDHNARVIDMLVMDGRGDALLSAMLAEGAEPSPETLRELRAYLPDQHSHPFDTTLDTVVMLALAGVDVNNNRNAFPGTRTHSQNLADHYGGHWPGIKKAEARLAALQDSPPSLGEWLDPAGRQTLLVALTMLKEGADVFSLHWRDPEERKTAYQLLPVQARRWVKHRCPDLAPLFREEDYPSPIEASMKGKFDLDVLAPGGKPSPQLLSWWKEIAFISHPGRWKNRHEDVIALHAMLPQELSRQADISAVQRLAPTPREDSVTVDYLHGSPAAGKGVA